jgi:hypothetical protein
MEITNTLITPGGLLIPLVVPPVFISLVSIPRQPLARFANITSQDALFLSWLLPLSIIILRFTHTVRFALVTESFSEVWIYSS